MAGLITITSGKWTTYRKMAEATVDLVCTKLGVQRPCRTAQETLPGGSEHGYHHQGSQLARIENDPTEKAIGQLICECELVTYPEVEKAILDRDARTIDDIRRDVRLGMGPCQGGFCTYRVSGILHTLRHTDVKTTNVALRDFLQERWKGLLPILWGQQLRQERLDELIYVSVLNADHLPGPKASALGPDLYLQPEEKPTHPEVGVFSDSKKGIAISEPVQNHHPTQPISVARKPLLDIDTIVVGAGLSGLVAAWQAAVLGNRVRVITKGWGSLYFNAGCIDVLGYLPQTGQEALESPYQGITQLIRENPHHPYALAGLDSIQEALDAFQDLCMRTGYPMQGSLDRNWSLPTSLGTFRPTCLAPETMVAGDLKNPGQVIIVGFNQYPDFYPQLIADNLKGQEIPAKGIMLELPSLRNRRYMNSKALALLFDQPEFRQEVVTSLKTHLDGSSTRGRELKVGFPAILGTEATLVIKQDLEAHLNLPVFEIPTLPPSIPGMRLSKMMIEVVEKAGGRVFEGMQVITADSEDGNLTTLWTEAAGRRKSHQARRFILATGGILGGGLKAERDGGIYDTALGLPTFPLLPSHEWFQREFLSPEGHPVFKVGIASNPEFQPVDSLGNRPYTNLRIAGATLAGGDYIRERSLEGVALVSGYLVGRKVA
jgi:glycerol-3-phosphate dehydrogenase subunit B